MPKSAAVGARAVVILGCLITIPLVALFGSSSPELLGKLVSLGTGETAAPAAETTNLTEAPVFRPTVPPVADPGVVPAGGPAPLAPAAPASYSGPSGVTVQPAIQDLPPTQPIAPFSAGPPNAGQPGIAGQPTAPPPAPPAATHTFESIQQRLRDLGAIYYKLESWGSTQQLFRFQCEMTVQGTGSLTRHFEAVDQRPLAAMQKVLAEAETWQASR